MVILMDSDAGGETAEPNETKKRIQSEFDAAPGFAWLTKGREIENYLPPSALEDAIKQTARDFGAMLNEGPYSKAYAYKDLQGNLVDKPDKVKIAHAIASGVPQLGILDLEEKLTKLVAFIRRANGIDGG
jgi:hypothetical protein